jgi:hypothetical protein
VSDSTKSIHTTAESPGTVGESIDAIAMDMQQEDTAPCPNCGAGQPLYDPSYSELCNSCGYVSYGFLND